MRRRLLVTTVLGLLCLGVGADAETKRFEVKPDEADPGKTFLVQGAWLAGIGCPTDARTVLPNASFTGPGDEGPRFTDPACVTGDPRDRHVEGLLLAKTGPSVTNFASAVARIDGVKGDVITELGWDIRKADETAAGPRGSHCGAGAPRWNIETRDGDFFFLGCNSPPAPVQTAGQGWLRMRWGGAVPLLAFQVPGFALVDIRGREIKSLSIVFDEGTDTGPDNFGIAVLDNIDVNGVLVGRGPTDAD